jgi:uncharacterized membrane protein
MPREGAPTILMQIGCSGQGRAGRTAPERPAGVARVVQLCQTAAEMPRSRNLLACFFTTTGVLHFVIPRSYEAMMPPSLPAHREAVIVSGAAEILGGALVLPPRTRRFARWWLLLLLAAVFPANLHMARNPEQVRGLDLERVPRWALWGRLPLQPLAMLWVWRATAG